MIEIFNRVLDSNDGDRWLLIGDAIQQRFLSIKYESALIPETWDYLGAAYQLRQIGGDWTICDRVNLRPGRANLVQWKNSTPPYRVELRLVKYLRAGVMVVQGLENSDIPEGYAE